MRATLYTLARFVLMVVLTTTPLLLSAQSQQKIDEQRKRVEQYRKDLESAKSEVSTLKKEKGSASRKVEALKKQMNLRNNYIAETEEERSLVEADMNNVSNRCDSLNQELEHNLKLYAEVVRIAHRNYTQNNFTSYIFSAENASDMARRIGQIEHVGEKYRALADSIKSQELRLQLERDKLTARRNELDSITRTLEDERKALAADKEEAQRSYNRLSDQEKRALNNQRKQQQRLDNALAELRKLTEGNTTGASFSDKTKNLSLPVVDGTLVKSQGNMAMISGKRGATVRSIYEGKVIRLAKDNTNHHMVFIAHGQYISVYTHLGSVSVKENQTVKRDQKIGTIGIGIDHNGSESAYMQFMINHAEPTKKMNVVDCFKKR